MLEKPYTDTLVEGHGSPKFVQIPVFHSTIDESDPEPPGSLISVVQEQRVNMVGQGFQSIVILTNYVSPTNKFVTLR